MNLSSIVPPICQVGWTPLGTGGHKSRLMVLTVDRRFLVLERLGRRWVTKVDLAAVLHQHLATRPAERLSPASDQAAVVSNLESRWYSLATSCWAWAGEADLYTGQMSGHLVHYEVTAGGARVRAVTRTQLRELSCVAHHQLAGGGAGLLLVGGGDGRVEVVRRDRAMTSLGWLWADPDRLPVNKILTRSTGDRVCVVMAKGQFLVQLDFRLSPGAKLEVNSPSVHNTGMTRVVGIEFYKDKLVFVNQKSAIGICDISKLQARDNVTLDWTGQVSRESYFCQGLAASTSGAVFTCLDNIATFNDHLIVREPGRLLFWSLETAASVRAQLEARAGALRLCGDLLECYRCLLGGGGGAEGGGRGGSTVVSWWHHKALLAHHRTHDPAKRAEVSSRVLECEARLRCEAAILVARNSDADPGARLASAGFIVQFSEDEQRVAEARELLASLAAVAPWRCRVCGEGEAVEARHVAVVRCGGGHTWPRCVASQRAVTDTCPGRCGWCGGLTSAAAAGTGSCALCQGPVTFAAGTQAS